LSELEYSIERADALVHEAVLRLSRSYPEHASDKAALEDLQRMSYHIEAALAKIEERRELTAKELSYRRAFRMLSEATR
jgi:hypothetical protein